MSDTNLFYCAALKRNISLGNCRFESVCCFFFLWLSRSLHLSWRLISLICVPWARLEPSSVFIIRTGRCSFALPPLPITSWDLLETSLHTDAFPWSLWSSVTYALSKTNFKCCLGQVLFFILDTIWSQEFYQDMHWHKTMCISIQKIPNSSVVSEDSLKQSHWPWCIESSSVPGS